MPTPPTIVAIVKDAALLRALAFVLQAHGHKVSAHRSWKMAKPSARQACCVILDGCLSAAEREACLADVRPETPVILLAEDDTVFAGRPFLQILHKPLTGTDVVAALKAIRGNP